MRGDGTVRAWVLDGFDDPALGDEQWDALLRSGDTAVPHLTRQWQRAWWDSLGPGRLLLIAAEQAGRIVALAPMYSQQGMVYFAGSGDADYLDFIGDIGAPEVLDAILGVAAAATAHFCGIRLFAIHGASRTGPRLQAAAARLGWWCYARSRSLTARLDLIAGRDHAVAAANGPKVSKRERYFSRHGSLELREFAGPAEITPRLETMFDQHVARWAASGVESRFAEAPHRLCLANLIDRSGTAFRPKLTCLEWRGRAIACELAWIYGDTYFAVVSCFAPDLAPRSPGQVLQRQIVLAALRDGLAAYDFGEGDYPYKLKYATDISHVETWDLFPIPPPKTADTEAGTC